MLCVILHIRAKAKSTLACGFPCMRMHVAHRHHVTEIWCCTTKKELRVVMKSCCDESTHLGVGVYSMLKSTCSRRQKLAFCCLCRVLASNVNIGLETAF